VPGLDRDTAREWIERWDRQQEESLPDREDRFTALIDAVEEGTGRPDPLVLDIGCGPGSLGIRLLARLPRATVIGIDADPVSLTLGRAAYSGVPGLRFVDLDLRVPGWPARLGLGTRAPDAAVSTTALHWLPEPELRAMYAELASVLRPGRQGISGPGPPGPGAAPARGRAALPRRASRELARLVGLRGRRSGAGRPRRRAGPPPGGGRSPRVGVDAARHPRRGPQGGRVRRGRHALAARRQPPAVRRPASMPVNLSQDHHPLRPGVRVRNAARRRR